MGGIYGMVNRIRVWMEPMGVASGCSCKEVKILLIPPYSSCICTFESIISTFPFTFQKYLLFKNISIFIMHCLEENMLSSTYIKCVGSLHFHDKNYV